MYGFGSAGGNWGGFLSDVVRVPFSDHMLAPLPAGVSAEAAASVSDNISDGWRLVAPGLEEWPGGEVLVAGGSPSVGLYGVQVAVALGAARVVYCDVEDERLRKAEELGAEAVGGYPDRLGPFPDHRDGVRGPRGSLARGALDGPRRHLHMRRDRLPARDPHPAARDVHEDHDLPHRPVHARSTMPRVLELMADGRLRPEAVTDRVLGWGEAPDALADNLGKLVFSRSR